MRALGFPTLSMFVITSSFARKAFLSRNNILSKGASLPTGLQGNIVSLRTSRPMYLHAKYAPSRLLYCGERHRHTGSPPLSLLYSHQTHICHRPVCYRNLFVLRKREHPRRLLPHTPDSRPQRYQMRTARDAIQASSLQAPLPQSLHRSAMWQQSPRRPVLSPR